MAATLHRDNWEQYSAICETEITSLKAEIERLRAALEEIAAPGRGDSIQDALRRLRGIAQDALVNEQRTPQAFIDAKKERDDGCPEDH